MLPEAIAVLVRALPERALVVATNGTLLLANAPAMAVLGDLRDGEDLLTRVAEPVAFQEYLLSTARTPSPVAGALHLRGLDGSLFEVRCEAFWLPIPETTPPDPVLLRLYDGTQADSAKGLSQTIAQLTEEVQRREEAQGRVQALHEEVTLRGEERFRLLVESVKDYAIFMLDPTGHIASWNEGAQRIKGYRAEEILGQHFSRFYPPEDVAGGKCEYELQVAAAEGRFEDESPRVRKDGTLFWANVIITALRDGKGNLVGFAKVTRDLTERKRQEEDRVERARAQQALRAAEENAERMRAMAEDLRRARDAAETSSRVKDEFLANVSHELRTPLNSIVGWSRLLQEGGMAPDKARQAVGAIVRNAEAQNHLIEDMLDVSRIVAGKFRLDVSDVDISQVAAAAVDVVRPAAEAKGIRLQVICDPHAGHVMGDAGRLQQVLWNLLSNAVKFTPRGGRVHLSLARKDSHVEIAVVDNGIGIDPEFLPRVFERFAQQVDVEASTSSRRYGGLGLGLSLVKHIVELHGGTAWVSSEGRGKGSAFTIQLPIVSVRTSEGPKSLPIVSTHGELECPREVDGLHVLVIDDEADSRDVTRAVLERCKAIVVTASSSSEAFEVLARDPKPDVIVSDIGMPGDDGYVFIRKLRSMPREAGGRIPAVALTAFARADDRRRALTAGFQNHAAKPIEPQELLIVVANLAGRFL